FGNSKFVLKYPQKSTAGANHGDTGKELAVTGLPNKYATDLLFESPHLAKKTLPFVLHRSFRSSDGGGRRAHADWFHKWFRFGCRRNEHGADLYFWGTRIYSPDFQSTTARGYCSDG